MNLLRLLAYAVIAWFVWTKVRRWLAAQNSARNTPPSRPPLTGKVVKCRYCELHLPEADAIRENDEWFCSRPHAHAFLTKT